MRISHKNGWIFDTVGDAGVVYSPNGRHYVISVYLWEETEFQDYEKLWPLLEEVSRAAWNFFNPENALLVPRANLPATAQECEGNYLPPGPEYVDLNDIKQLETQIRICICRWNGRWSGHVTVGRAGIWTRIIRAKSCQ